MKAANCYINKGQSQRTSTVYVNTKTKCKPLTKVLCFEEPVAGVAMEEGRLSRGKVLGVPRDFVSKSSSSSSSILRSFRTLSLTCLWCRRERILGRLSFKEGGAHASTKRAVVAGMPPALSFRLKESSKLSLWPVESKQIIYRILTCFILLRWSLANQQIILSRLISMLYWIWSKISLKHRKRDIFCWSIPQGHPRSCGAHLGNQSVFVLDLHS